MLEFTSATRVTDLASRSQSYPTVTLSRQQSSGQLATTERGKKRQAERQAGDTGDKEKEQKEMRVI